MHKYTHTYIYIYTWATRNDMRESPRIYKVRQRISDINTHPCASPPTHPRANEALLQNGLSSVCKTKTPRQYIDSYSITVDTTVQFWSLFCKKSYA